MFLKYLFPFVFHNYKCVCIFPDSVRVRRAANEALPGWVLIAACYFVGPWTKFRSGDGLTFCHIFI
jgi:hypothetical protein